MPGFLEFFVLTLVPLITSTIIVGFMCFFIVWFRKSDFEADFAYIIADSSNQIATFIYAIAILLMFIYGLFYKPVPNVIFILFILVIIFRMLPFITRAISIQHSVDKFSKAKKLVEDRISKKNKENEKEKFKEDKEFDITTDMLNRLACSYTCRYMRIKECNTPTCIRYKTS